MRITKIKVENFKSYKKFEISLNKLNFIIGSNAAGKSNFVNILKFFNDIIDYGIDDAILLQGGIKYLFNSNSSRGSDILLDLEINFDEEQKEISHLFLVDEQVYLPEYVRYSLKIKPNEKGEGYKISRERIEIFFNQFKKKNGKLTKIDSFVVEIEKDAKNRVTDNLGDKRLSDEGELINLRYIIILIERDGLLLNNFFSSLEIFYRSSSKIKIYNFDVNLLKSPSSLVARSELEENGANLVNIIQQLLKSKDKKNKLNKLIKSILPFVEDIKVENNVNKSLFFKVKESYNDNEYPSYMLSDGTVNILAVIVALYFQDDNEIIVLEEPERNIHPKLLSKLVFILQNISSKKQIFVTTHNPYVIKEADLKDIVLVSRDKLGISKISKPIDDSKVNQFLQHDLGIDDLFVDGILK